MSNFPNRSFFAQKKERSLIFKISDCPTLDWWEGWAFAHFENERLLFFLSEKWAIWKISHFLLLFALSLFLKERLSERSLFWKERMSKQSLISSIAKSEWASDCSFALLQWANERAIAHLLFCNEQMSNKLLNRSFTMSEWAKNCSIALLQWAEMSDEQSSEWAIAQLCKKAIALFIALLIGAKKERSLIRFLEKSEKRAIAHLLFKKERSVICSFEKSKKRAIAHSLFYMEQQNERLLFRSFSKSKWATDCLITLLKRAEMSNERLPNLGQSLMAHFRSLQKNDWAIYCSFTHCKRAIERFVAHSLIVKEQMSDCSLICSLQKRKWAIVCSFALFKRAIARSIALSKRAKNERFPKLLIFHSKKWAIAHFQNERLPNPAEIPEKTAGKNIF